MMSSAVDQPEMTLIAGLLQSPMRLSGVGQLDPKVFEDAACRISFIIIRDHHAAAAQLGRVRYCTGELLVDGAKKRLAKAARVKGEKGKKAKAVISTIVGMVDEIESDWNVVPDAVFDSAVDAISEDYRDRSTQTALEEIVDEYAAKGCKGLYQKVSELAVQLNPMVADHSGANLKDDAVNAVVEAVRAKNDTRSAGLPTPWHQLNRLTDCGGGKPGRMWITSAYTGDGKTMCAINMAYQAMLDGRGVMYVSREQTREEIRNLFMVRHSLKFRQQGISISKLNSGDMCPQEWKDLKRTARDLRDDSALGPLHIWQAPPGTNVGDIRNRAQFVAQRQAVDMIVIDHTELFHPEPREGVRLTSANERISMTIQQCKELAMTFNGRTGAWVVLCHQINRAGYEKAQGRGYYLLSDLSGSSEAERSADLVMWLWRDEALRDLSEIRIGISKNRQGEICQGGFTAIEDFGSAALLPLGTI
jgi:replicative DNA helicase